MAKIFISYRHEDSAYISHWLYIALANEFGKENVFHDSSSIPAGAKFNAWIEGETSSCIVLLAVMGKRWLTSEDEHANRRIYHPNDWVVKEIKKALDRDVPVIPVLLEDIRVPRVDDLPPTLADLPSCQAIRLRPADDFEHDIGRLIVAIKTWYPLKSVEMPTQIQFVIKESASAHEDISFVKLLPDPSQGEALSLDEYNLFLTDIGRLLKNHPELRNITEHELVEGLDVPSIDTIDFQAIFELERENGRQVLTALLNDKQARLPEDVSPWRLNLQRFSRKRGYKIDIYHNGDNSLPSPYREGSYGRNAPYSIAKYAAQLFPTLRSANENLVYLGSVSSDNYVQFGEEFTDVQHRLALYRFARWLWLWNHPRRI